MLVAWLVELVDVSVEILSMVSELVVALVEVLVSVVVQRAVSSVTNSLAAMALETGEMVKKAASANISIFNGMSYPP